MTDYHIPVLLQESRENLHVREGSRYIDATLGGGGHSLEIVKHGGSVLGIDVDDEAIEHAQEKFKIENNITLVRGNFRDIGSIARAHGFEKVSGILFDLGLSSRQIDDGARGFSFTHSGPLDMRMDKTLDVKASDLLKVLTKQELTDLFTRFGEERNAWSIATYITKVRDEKPIETTEDLVRLLEKVRGISFDPKERAQSSMRIFQALRIAINDELGSLEQSLPQAVSLLENNGRLVVISFHSLEDRIVKQLLKQFEEEGKGHIVTKKPIVPSEEELEQNPRSRSAKMRVFQRTSI